MLTLRKPNRLRDGFLTTAKHVLVGTERRVQDVDEGPFAGFLSDANVTVFGCGASVHANDSGEQRRRSNGQGLPCGGRTVSSMVAGADDNEHYDGADRREARERRRFYRTFTRLVFWSPDVSSKAERMMTRIKCSGSRERINASSRTVWRRRTRLADPAR